ncbi:hypothetical protein HN587_04630 [Candidatus Woesearchaeota archaeon]|nr:hypothetical protein [Candidatus Woesearchaeota archaeon]
MSEKEVLYWDNSIFLDALRKNSNIAVLGPNSCGKETLIKTHFASLKPKHALICDLNRLSISPEQFSIEFVGTIVWSYFSNNSVERSKYYDADFLIEQALSKQCKEIIGVIQNELQKIKPDQTLLLESAFDFSEYFAKHIKQKMSIAFLNFENLLDFNNYSQIRDILDLFFTRMNSHKHVNYIFSSSFTNKLTGLLKYRVDLLEMKYWDKDATIHYIEKVLKYNFDRHVISQIYNFSGGIPFLVRTLSKSLYLKFKEEQSTKQDSFKISNENLFAFFVQNLSSKFSPLYSFCNKTYSTALTNARGATLLKVVLKVMTHNPDLRLTEIARQVYRSGPVTKSLLERLMEVDIIKKEGKVFVFATPLLKIWCKLMFNNISIKDSDIISLASLAELEDFLR